VVELLDAATVVLDVVCGLAHPELVAAHGSSPSRSVSGRLYGSRPASARRLRAASWATPYQSSQNSAELGLRKMNQARFAVLKGSKNTGEYSAFPTG
jgi:hypothetical protein